MEVDVPRTILSSSMDTEGDWLWNDDDDDDNDDGDDDDDDVFVYCSC